jgi:hypothetical protein
MSVDGNWISRNTSINFLTNFYSLYIPNYQFPTPNSLLPTYNSLLTTPYFLLPTFYSLFPYLCPAIYTESLRSEV